MWKMYKTQVIYEIHTIQRAKVMIFDSAICRQKTYTRSKPPKWCKKNEAQKKHKI